MDNQKHVAFIVFSKVKEHVAQSSRMLAMSKGLHQNGCVVEWIVLSHYVDQNILDQYSDTILFTKVGMLPSSIRYVSTLMSYLNVFALIALFRTRRNSLPKACFLSIDSFIILKTIQLMLKHFKIKIFHERGEFPYYQGKVSIFRKINLDLYMKYAVPSFDAIFLISSALVDYFQEAVGTGNSKTKIKLLPMLVEEDVYAKDDEQSNELPTNHQNIVYTGTMYGDKDGVYDLITAYGQICGDIPHSRLILIGNNKEKEKMKKNLSALEELSCKENVIFTGLLGKKDLIKWLKSAYCLALARPDNQQAKYGFPTKLGEYLATGRPVVITSVGDIPLYLKDGINAYVSAPDDPQAFAQKLRDCLSDEQAAKRIGETGRSLVNEVFNPARATKMIVDELA
ncbi:MAG: glycosyltransferase family 4 protein [Firmicutes bacterium]|jgi:glycosyltransferase involved in cell wall biosynthesis|nr:glycosyltransferase family 4 protein [Bacillota bacterium]